MLVREGKARTHEADRGLACSLAFVAGCLNAAGFYAFGFFSGNMTGNTSALADHVALGELSLAARYFALVVLFILGATASTLLINLGRRRGLGSVYLLSVLTEATLLTLLGGVAMIVDITWRGELMVFGLSFLMGLQNALVTRISDARVRTTHVTGMVTDIGIELANLLSSWAGVAGERADPTDRRKLALHVQTVIAFLVGGVIGVLAYRHVGPMLLFAMAAVLLALVTPGLVAPRAR